MRSRGEAGQAVVEAAIVLPAMVFLLLLTLQLTQLQQARIMVEYAAFAAARTGIVHDGDNGTSNGFNGPMHDAAALAVLPTYGRTDGWTRMGATLARFTAEDLALRAFGLSQVRVYVWNPVKSDFATFGQHLNGKEIDFDDQRPAAADAALLSIQVRYLYEMRVPFANKLIQGIWMAAKLGILSTPTGGWQGFDLTSPRFNSANGPDAVAVTRALAVGTRIPDGTPEGIPLAGLVAAGQAGRFFLPVEAWYTMRMQSNPYLRFAR